MSTNSVPFSATTGGAIAVSSFVTQSLTADKTLLQASTNSPIIGVSQVGSHDAPGTNGASANAATAAGQSIELFILGDVCHITLGGTVTRGDYLKSDANGNAITGVAGMDNIGAVALESGVSGQLVLCVVVLLPSTNAVKLPAITAATYTATDSDGVIFADATAATIAITLPSAVGRLGKKYTIIKTTTANTVTVATVNGGTYTIPTGSLTSGAILTSVTVISDGTNWWTFSH